MIKIIAEITAPPSEVEKLKSYLATKLQRNASILATSFIWKQEKKKEVITNARGKSKKYEQLLYSN